MIIIFGQIQIVYGQSNSESPKYSFRVMGGYSFLSKDSDLSKLSTKSDLMVGPAISFQFNYKLANTKTYDQFMTENLRLNFKNDNGDNFQNIHLMQLGLKMHPAFYDKLYFIVGCGIMTGKIINTRMMMSAQLGLEIFTSSTST